MSHVVRFLEYAEAFETAFESDEWNAFADYFAPDAEYVAIDGTRVAGREQIIEAFRDSVNTIDRRFDERIVKPLDPQITEDGSVFMTWEITFRKQGAPDLRVIGSGEATYEGEEISKLVDRLEDGVGETMAAWMGEHGSKLA